jgi:hypothetical protein
VSGLSSAASHVHDLQLLRTNPPVGPLPAFQLTYSPAHRANGTPLDPTASRNVLGQRRTAIVRARHSDAAVWAFERDTDRMATACRRLQDANQQRADLEGRA